MARTTAPLLGFDARGQIAKTLVYGTWRGVKYARRYVIPGNPKTAGQTTTRVTFATLREMWKLMPTIGRSPWTAFATGRPFLNLNAFVGENMRVVRGDALFTDFVGSPGARGGLPPTSATPASGGAGEINVTFVLPTIPTGWAIQKSQCVAFQDQDPESDFVGNLVAAESATPFTTVAFTGLDATTSYIVASWLEWLKPNGQIAYSIGLTSTVTSG